MPALDGIRGFAALAVAAMHLSVSFGLLPYTPLGHTGVTVFFVFSGYLISRMWYGRDDTPPSFRRFIPATDETPARRHGPIADRRIRTRCFRWCISGRSPATRDAGTGDVQLTAFASARGYKPSLGLRADLESDRRMGLLSDLLRSP